MAEIGTKPCPFCGRYRLDGNTSTWGDTPSYHLSYNNCGAATRRGDSQEEARVIWNTRPIEQSLEAQIFALESELAATKAAVVQWVKPEDILPSDGRLFVISKSDHFAVLKCPEYFTTRQIAIELKARACKEWAYLPQPEKVTND